MRFGKAAVIIAVAMNSDGVRCFSRSALAPFSASSAGAVLVLVVVIVVVIVLFPLKSGVVTKLYGDHPFTGSTLDHRGHSYTPSEDAIFGVWL